MTLVYVAEHARFTAVHAPGVPTTTCLDRKCASHTSDWRAPAGSPENAHRIETRYAPTTLDELRTMRYRSEAHFVTYELFYVASGVALPAQPRIAKDAMPWLREQGIDARMTCFAADVDTPGHVAWTEEMRREFYALWAARPTVLATCAVYLSLKGYRLIQPLKTPLIVEAGERALRAWIERLVAAGVWVSVREVRDWTRHFRTPHHLRTGARVSSEWQDWSRCEAVEVEVPAEAPRAPTRRRTNNAAPRAVEAFDDVCPAGWEPVADAVGEAIRDHVKSDWRRCYLALSGALLERGCPPEGVPSLVARAHLVDPQWSSLLTDRVTIARNTVLRWGTGLEVSGAAALRSGWPLVAEALDASTSNGAEAQVLRQLASVERRITDVTEATSTLRQEIRDAYGVVLLAGPPGLGKTEAVIDHAKGLAKIDGRAKPGQRIGLSAPTTALATEIQRRAEGAGVRTLRVFGPLGHTQADGTPTCIHHEVAKPLVAGAQSLEQLFCAPDAGAPCERALSCPARNGLDGDPSANLVVGPHELVGVVATSVGKAGTLVIDEPPQLVEVTAVRLCDLDLALDELVAFEGSYTSRLAPSLHAIAAWASAAEPGAVVTAADAVAAGASSVRADLVRGFATEGGLGAEIVRRAQLATGEAKSIAPPLTLVTRVAVRRNVARSTIIGLASSVYVAIWRALQPAEEGLHPSRLRVIERDGARVLSIVGANDRAVAALRRDAPTVVLDAGAALIAPTVQRIVGYAPRLVELDVSDGAPVERTILACGRATRSRLFDRGSSLNLDALIPLLRAVFAWAREDPDTNSLVVVSWGAVEALLAHALDLPGGAPTPLKRAGVTQKAAAEARERLEDIVAPWRGRVRLAHYGGLRGLDHLRDADALATVGDPRPTLDAENDRSAWLDADADGRVDALAAAELDQAHGRLRLVHRERKARALHVGAIVPAGWCGRDVAVRRMAAGRPAAKCPSGMSASELVSKRNAAGLSQSALALLVGVSQMTMSRYESSARAIPSDVAVKILECLSRVAAKSAF